MGDGFSSCMFWIDRAKLDKLVDEFRGIRDNLEKALDENDKSGYYDDLINLIKKISDHIIKTKAAKERIGEAIMGGKVLTLPSDYIAQGVAQGIAQGYDKGLSDGSTTTIY